MAGRPEDEIAQILSKIDPLATRWASGKSAQVFIEAAVQAEPGEVRDLVETIARIAFHEGLTAGRNEKAAQSATEGD